MTIGVASPADRAFDENNSQSSARIQIPVSGSSIPRFGSMSQLTCPPAASASDCRDLVVSCSDIWIARKLMVDDRTG